MEPLKSYGHPKALRNRRLFDAWGASGLNPAAAHANTLAGKIPPGFTEEEDWTGEDRFAPTNAAGPLKGLKNSYR